MGNFRECVRAGSALTALLAVSGLSGLAYGADVPDISGTYWATEYHAKIQIVGGGVLATPYPFEIIQAPPGQITIIHELNHQVRAIAMDKPLPSDKELIPFPFYNGHSVGRFDGDTLVVETAGFNEKTFVDATGAPHTDEIHTVERIRKISPTQIEDVITIHDPEYYTRDWQARFVYNQRNDVRLEDYVCGEPHRDISSVAGVRRP